MHKRIPVALNEGTAQDEEQGAEAVEWWNPLASRAIPVADTKQIDDLEDYSLGMETLERVRKGEEALYPESVVRRELGLEE